MDGAVSLKSLLGKPDNPFYGKKHSEETKNRIKETKKRNRELIEEEKRMMIF